MEMKPDRIALCFNYDGTHFCGFQVQRRQRTVQGELETALHTLYTLPVRVHPSGRTDKGVHALRQYAHFAQPLLQKHSIPPHKLSHALNPLLPPDLRITYSRVVPCNFHARYSAQSRTYYYAMHTSAVSFSPWRNVFASVSPDIQWHLWMQDARELIGTHDFAGLCKGATALHRQGKSTVRVIKRVSLVKEGKIMKFFIEANGFLWNMVRTIVGMLISRACLSVTAHRRLPSVRTILERCHVNKERIMVRPAPAHGLYLYDVKYNDSYAMEHKPIPPSEY